MGQCCCFLAAAAAIVALAQIATPATGEPFPRCGTTSNFSANSTFQANLDRVTASLARNTSTSRYLYAASVAGTVPEQVWAMGICRGDVDADTCFTCLEVALPYVRGNCSHFKDATVYYDFCTLHYSDVHTLPSDDTGPTRDALSIINHDEQQVVTSEPARYNGLLAALLNATADYAAFNSTRRFATGEADFNQQFPKVYTLAQCPPDQPPWQCRRCLAGIIAGYLPTFRGSIGGRVLLVNCTYRFSTESFYDGPAMVSLASSSDGPPAPAPAVEKTAATGRDATRTYPKFSDETEDVEVVDSMLIAVSTLRAATEDFDDSNKLGEGGFGAVYKGVLPDGEEIAVKRLSQSSTQGVEELKNELALVVKLKHKNLVRLVGVCLEQQERLLVYEYVPNRSLDLVLFGGQERLGWEQRYRIINGVARGLQYLHEDSQLRVIHRDLKASNILLDANMDPKISDFGLARFISRDQTQAVTSRIVGTYGYMAPEYVMRGTYSVKSDVFSFGVIVLEIVTGRKNNDSLRLQAEHLSGDLLNTVWEHWEAGTVMELVDTSMNGSLPVGDLLRCFHVGLLCVQGDPMARPVMSSVAMMLGADTVTLHTPSKPGLFAGNNGVNPGVSSPV